MKNFSQFVEGISLASFQAKRLGLVGDGHGGWNNNKTGEFEAKTVGGRLHFYNKRQRLGQQGLKRRLKITSSAIMRIRLSSWLSRNMPLKSLLRKRPQGMSCTDWKSLKRYRSLITLYKGLQAT